MMNEEIISSVRKVFSAMLRATDVAPLCSTREFPSEKIAYDRDWHWKTCLERALNGDPDPMREEGKPMSKEQAKNGLVGISIGMAALKIAMEDKE